VADTLNGCIQMPKVCFGSALICAAPVADANSERVANVLPHFRVVANRGECQARKCYGTHELSGTGYCFPHIKCYGQSSSRLIGCINLSKGKECFCYQVLVVRKVQYVRAKNPERIVYSVVSDRGYDYKGTGG